MTRKLKGKPSHLLVFVSHASSDKWIAKRICEQFDSIPGVATFRDDRDIEGGEDIPKKLKVELAKADLLVVLLTPESHGRAWVLVEVGAYWGKPGKDRPILPVTCHIDEDRVPEMLKRQKRVSLNDLDLFVEQLRRKQIGAGS